MEFTVFVYQMQKVHKKRGKRVTTMSSISTLSIPPLRVHKGKNLAFVRLPDGAFRYFGRPDGTDTDRKYRLFVAEWIATGAIPAKPKAKAKEECGSAGNAGVSIKELCDAYKADRQNRRGSLTSYDIIALRDLTDAFGNIPAATFGPKRLKTLRGMWEAGTALRVAGPERKCRRMRRSTINQAVSSVKRIFKWAVAEEMVAETVAFAVSVVSPLMEGETEAPEPQGVGIVEEKVIKETCKHLPPMLADVVQLLRMTGARPSEVLNLTPGHIVVTDDTLWTAPLSKHKNSKRGKYRELQFGAKGIAILRKYMLRPSDAPMFPPLEALKQRNEGKIHRHQPPAPPTTDRTLNAVYSYKSLRNAIVDAAKKAGVTPWCPYSLRHTRGTEIHRQFGGDAARVSLGHSDIETTKIYVEPDIELARKIARETA